MRTHAIALCLTILGSTSAPSLRAETLVGPFETATGSYRVIPGGDFESGDMAGWVDNMQSRGVFRPSSEASVSGRYCARSTVVTAGNGPGFGAQGSVSVEPGQTYVLSAFFLAADVTGASTMSRSLRKRSSAPDPGAPYLDRGLPAEALLAHSARPDVSGSAPC